MRPMTREEYEKFEFAETDDNHYDDRYTRIPPTIAKIHRQHFESAADILMWLHSLGCEFTHDFYAKEGRKELCDCLVLNTAFSIKIRHDNDYVECGPTSEDPLGNHFIIKTPFSINVKFLPENLQAITQQLELFSEHKLPINKKLSNIHLSFYSHEREIFMDSMYSYSKYEMKLSYKLRFEIFHTWR